MIAITGPEAHSSAENLFASFIQLIHDTPVQTIGRWMLSHLVCVLAGVDDWLDGCDSDRPSRQALERAEREWSLLMGIEGLPAGFPTAREELDVVWLQEVIALVYGRWVKEDCESYRGSAHSLLQLDFNSFNWKQNEKKAVSLLVHYHSLVLPECDIITEHYAANVVAQRHRPASYWRGSLTRSGTRLLLVLLLLLLLLLLLSLHCHCHCRSTITTGSS